MPAELLLPQPQTSFHMFCEEVLPEWVSLKTDVWSFGTMVVRLFVGSRGPHSQREVSFVYDITSLSSICVCIYIYNYIYILYVYVIYCHGNLQTILYTYLRESLQALGT